MPSNVKIPCPSCGQQYRIDPKLAGNTFVCEKCNESFTAQIPSQSKNLSSDPSATQKHNVVTNRSISSKINIILDGFLGILFRFGKTFSGLLAIVFLLGMLFSCFVFVTNLRSSIEVPTYDQMVDMSKGKASDPSQPTALDTRRDIEKRYGDDVAKLVKDYSLDDSVYDGLIQFICGLEKEHRGKYLSGLKTFLKEAAKSKKHTSMEALEFYTTAFAAADIKALDAKGQAELTRWYALGSIVVCCFMLFMMLVIPALLRIEENTRPKLMK